MTVLALIPTSPRGAVMAVKVSTKPRTPSFAFHWIISASDTWRDVPGIEKVHDKVQLGYSIVVLTVPTNKEVTTPEELTLATVICRLV